MKKLSIFLLLFVCIQLNAQHNIIIQANFNPDHNTVEIVQSITFTNTASKPIDYLYLNDWNNAFSNNQTDLAKRFAEEYTAKLFYAKDSERGFTTIKYIQNKQEKLIYKRKYADIIEVQLTNTLASKDSITLNLKYNLQLPADKFTRFGIDSNKNIKLKEWFITPAKLIAGKWEYYTHKNLDDLYIPNCNIKLTITYPKSYTLNSTFNVLNTINNTTTKTTILQSENTIYTEFYLTKKSNFRSFETDKFTFITNINDNKVSDTFKAVIHDKIAYFLTDKLGDYPHQKIVLSEACYHKNPVYGLNQLPNFIRPFPDGFQYEIKILKSTIAKFIRNTINTNPHTDFWLSDALETYLMIQYVNENYPNMKILGSLSKIWGLRSFEIAKKKFNSQYQYFSQYTARKNLDQPIKTPKDSLLKYNANISNKNKAGVGLLYLDDYLGNQLVSKTMSEFYQQNKLKNIHSKDFIDALQRKTNKDISWFLNDYINTDKRIDYTIKNITKENHQLLITLKNKTTATTPISIYQLIDGKIISKKYINGFTGDKIVKLPNHNPDRIILNYESIIPEYNQRDNTKTLKPHLFNKPLKFSFLKDAEAPKYNQIFYVPEFGYNLYDGFSPGIRLTNKSLLRKNFTFSIKPLYSMKSKAITGSIGFGKTHHFKNRKLFNINYGMHYQNFHYKNDLKYQRFTPTLNFNFKRKNNLRSDYYQYITTRYISVKKDKDTSPLLPNEIRSDIPNYNVFNIKYGVGDSDLFNSYGFNADVQFAKDFGKIALTYGFRKLYKNNRQVNLRFFAGAFTYNNTNTNYYSFALDRPSDYLFDYDYYGRSESTGLFSQQIIITEGGFKSKLNTNTANKWMTTASISTNLWRYIFVYGDIGLVGNTGNPNAVYDTGVHLNLVPGYFELYFPVSSNLGWEIAQPHYNEKIRFKIVLTPKILIGLVTRKWL